MEAPWVELGGCWERVAAGSGSLGAASSESAAGSGRLRGCGCCVLSRAAVSIVALSGAVVSRVGCVFGGFGWL